MNYFCQIQPTLRLNYGQDPTRFTWKYRTTPSPFFFFCLLHMDTSSPSLTCSWQPLCFSWAGATESIIFLQLSHCSCLINDTTNNICHAVTSVSSSQLAQLGAALCRLPPQIRTPLEKLFTHLSSPQAPLHFVCPPKDPNGGHYNLFQSEK